MYKEIKKIEFDYSKYRVSYLDCMNNNLVFLSDGVDYLCINIETNEVLFENFDDHEFYG